MTISYRSLASNLLLAAFTMSAAYQLYRASLGTSFAVDRFTAVTAVAYASFFLVAAAVRTDRIWVWWVTGALELLGLVYGIVGYYPTVYAARPLEVLDWLEGTLYTGLLLAALGCTVLRLTGSTLSATGTSAGAAPGAGAERTEQAPAGGPALHRR